MFSCLPWLGRFSVVHLFLRAQLTESWLYAGWSGSSLDMRYLKMPDAPSLGSGDNGPLALVSCFNLGLREVKYSYFLGRLSLYLQCDFYILLNILNLLYSRSVS